MALAEYEHVQVAILVLFLLLTIGALKDKYQNLFQFHTTNGFTHSCHCSQFSRYLFEPLFEFPIHTIRYRAGLLGAVGLSLVMMVFEDSKNCEPVHDIVMYYSCVMCYSVGCHRRCLDKLHSNFAKLSFSILVWIMCILQKEIITWNKP